MLLEQPHVPQEVLPVLPSNLAFQLRVSIQTRVTALQEAGALLCQTTRGCTGKENLPRNGGTYTLRTLRALKVNLKFQS